MTLEMVARAYVQCIQLEETARLHGEDLAEQAMELRSELHALLMQALREANIPFNDRAEAAEIAYQLAQPLSHPA